LEELERQLLEARSAGGSSADSNGSNGSNSNGKANGSEIAGRQQQHGNRAVDRAVADEEVGRLREQLGEVVTELARQGEELEKERGLGREGREREDELLDELVEAKTKIEGLQVQC
jgi:hypothetical protein